METKLKEWWVKEKADSPYKAFREPGTVVEIVGGDDSFYLDITEYDCPVSSIIIEKDTYVEISDRGIFIQYDEGVKRFIKKP